MGSENNHSSKTTDISELVGYGPGIAKTRKKMGILQQDLATKIGVCVRTLRLYETNKKFPTLDQAIAICNVLEIPLDEFITYSEDLKSKWAVNGIHNDKNTQRSDEEIIDELLSNSKYKNLKIQFLEKEVERLQKIIDD